MDDAGPQPSAQMSCVTPAPPGGACTHRSALQAQSWGVGAGVAEQTSAHCALVMPASPEGAAKQCPSTQRYCEPGETGVGGGVGGNVGGGVGVGGVGTGVGGGVGGGVGTEGGGGVGGGVGGTVGGGVGGGVGMMQLAMHVAFVVKAPPALGAHV